MGGTTSSSHVNADVACWGEEAVCSFIFSVDRARLKLSKTIVLRCVIVELYSV